MLHLYYLDILAETIRWKTQSFIEHCAQKNSHPTGVDAINTPQPLRPKQSVGKANEPYRVSNASNIIDPSTNVQDAHELSPSKSSILNSSNMSTMARKSRSITVRSPFGGSFFVAFLVAHCYYVREMHFEILNKFEIL